MCNFCRVVLFLFLSCFALSNVVLPTEPVDWPKPVANEGENPGGDPSDGSSGPPPYIGNYADVPPGDAESTVLRARVSLEEEPARETETSGRFFPWVVWFDIFVTLFN